MMTKNILLCWFMLLLFLVNAQTPTYYQNIDFTLTGDSLKQELSDLIINTHSSPLEYTSSSSTDTWDVIKQSDLSLLDNTSVLLVYGYDDSDQAFENDRTRDKTLSCHSSPCDGLWNREHVFPKSLASPSLSTNNPGPGTDVHNLRSCDYVTNTWRGNLKFGNKSGNSGVNSYGNWYPGDEWKGDVARIVMYMYLRYPSQCKPNNVGEGASSYSNFGDMPNLFLEWNQLDPVDQYELNRNDLIEMNQGNRNPFIDNPFLATVIWNGPVANNPWGPLQNQAFSTTFDFKFYPNPVKEVLNIEQANCVEPYEIEVYDIFYKKLTTFNNEIFNMEYLKAGVYFLMVNQGENKKAYKIIKD